MFNMFMETFWVVEHAGSQGFFLQMDYKDSDPSFTGYIGTASKYSSEDLAHSVIDMVHSKGFTMELEVKELNIAYSLQGRADR
jgi:hypothetical protein